MLMSLEALCPKTKLKEYENIKKIVQKHQPKQVEVSSMETAK